jgi:regulator of sigma E protease
MPFAAGIIFILILGLLVYVHELGHFLAAKAVGVRVEEFAFGFGPRLVTLMRRNGTDYTIHAFPLGGFVNLVGMQPEDEEVPDGLMSKSRPARAFVFFAGPLMNLILAVLVFATMGMITGSHRDRSNQVVEVFPNTPAARAGLLPGDRIVEIGGRPIRDGQAMFQTIERSAGQTLTVKVQRDGELVTLTATPKAETFKVDGKKRTVGRLGFRPGENISNEVLSVPEKSPANAAGLKEGDRIVAANGKPIGNGDEMLIAISGSPGKPLDLTVRRNGKEVALRATPEPTVIIGGGLEAKRAGEYKLMVDEPVYAVNGRPVRSTQEVIDALALRSSPAKLTVERQKKRVEIEVPLTAAMVQNGFVTTVGRLSFVPGVLFERMGFQESVRTGMEDLQRVLLILFELVKRNELKDNAGGPIMMYRMVEMNSRFQPGYQMALIGQLSLSLAIFNLLPIPVLDGGHLLLLGVEALRRRRLDPAWHRAATALGLVVIGILFLLMMYSDIAKWVSGQPLIQ